MCKWFQPLPNAVQPECWGPSTGSQCILLSLTVLTQAPFSLSWVWEKKLPYPLFTDEYGLCLWCYPRGCPTLPPAKDRMSLFGLLQMSRNWQKIYLYIWRGKKPQWLSLKAFWNIKAHLYGKEGWGLRMVSFNNHRQNRTLPTPEYAICTTFCKDFISLSRVFQIERFHGRPPNVHFTTSSIS